MSYEDLYDFCLDWQMDHEPKAILVARFVKNGWNFEEFKRRAKANDWFVASMDGLKNAL